MPCEDHRTQALLVVLAADVHNLRNLGGIVLVLTKFESGYESTRRSFDIEHILAFWCFDQL